MNQKRIPTPSLLIVALAFCLHAEAAPKTASQTWTDPAEAAGQDPDFVIQGEYVTDADAGTLWGLQVVALGGGAFEAYLLDGGLPGAGWTRERERIKLQGTRDADLVSFASTDAKIQGQLKDGVVSLKREDKTVPALRKIARTSPTLGAKPPKNAIVLFDGSSADAWNKGRVENGLLPNSDITTKRNFGDYQLHLEFRTPYKPFARGQQRGNSGVYHQGRFETQVLDSFGLEGKMNECGGIYSIAAPILNMCFPPLSWQTYDVDFTAARFDDAGKLTAPARMTVRLNGVIIHDKQELPKTTTASPVRQVTPEPGPIYIQHHGNPVYYRNIWIVEK